MSIRRLARSRPLLRLLLTLLLWLGGQYAAAVHGTEHPFHDHESACDLYSTADHQGQAPLVAPPILTPALQGVEALAPRLLSRPPRPIPAYQARAPPDLP